MKPPVQKKAEGEKCKHQSHFAIHFIESGYRFEGEDDKFGISREQCHDCGSQFMNGYIVKNLYKKGLKHPIIELGQL